jgi:hypothetical protein
MIRNILEKGLDKQMASSDDPAPIPNHENIRGKDHYQ